MHNEFTNAQRAEVLTAALPLEATAVPKTALIREFIGDSVFHK